jgi:hypothetical protein
VNSAEFEHLLGVDPRASARKLDAKALQLSGACGDAEMRLARALKFEAELDLAFAAPTMPAALTQQLLAIATTQPPADTLTQRPGQFSNAATARRPALRRWLSIAAGVSILALGTLTAYTMRTPSYPLNSALAEHCAEHMSHEPFALTRQSVVPSELVTRMFVEHGFSAKMPDGRAITEVLGAVNYLSPCHVQGKSAIHMVVQTSAGPVTVLVMRDAATDGASEMHVGGALVRVSPLARNVAMVLVAESGVTMDSVEMNFVKALSPASV